MLSLASCVKKVVPHPNENEFIDLQKASLAFQTGYPYPNYCSGLNLDKDTTTDFRTCVGAYSGRQAHYDHLSFTVYNNIRLETTFDTNATKCRYNISIYVTNANSKYKLSLLKFRHSGETVVTADTTSLSNFGSVSYYAGPGAQGIALQGNCSYSVLPKDSIYYVV